MNISLTRELETLFFILLASSIGLFAVFSLRQYKEPTQFHITAPLPNFSSDATPTPTLIPVVSQPTTTSWTSSDGIEKVTMTELKNQDTTKTYTFTLSDTASNNTIPLFNKTVSDTSSMAIPYNAFSPDNAYAFLSENDGTTTHYFVFKSSGEAFADGEKYLDITPLFASYTSNDSLSDVTGWADPSLLVVNAKTSDGKLQSFWFDVTTKGFIPLATVFE